MVKLKKTITKVYLRIIFQSRGATAVEYGIMVSLIAGVIIASVFTLGQEVIGLFEAVTENYP